jgi:RsmE family RNA methyltransferase
VPKVNLFEELQKISSYLSPLTSHPSPHTSDLSPLTSDLSPLLVLIGPEGDFSIDEVRMAVEAGFVSVDLGKSRLRTETAALSAVMMMQLAMQK